MRHPHRLNARTIHAVEARDISQPVPKPPVQSFLAALGQILRSADMALDRPLNHPPHTLPARTFYPNHQIGARQPQVETVHSIIAVRDPSVPGNRFPQTRPECIHGNRLPAGLPVESIQMNHRYAQPLAQAPRQCRFAAACRTYDDNSLHAWVHRFGNR